MIYNLIYNWREGCFMRYRSVSTLPAISVLLAIKRAVAPPELMKKPGYSLTREAGLQLFCSVIFSSVLHANR